MRIWLECKEENLVIELETDTKPTVGDTVRIEDKEYGVEKVIWCLNEMPAQSGLLIQISPKDMCVLPGIFHQHVR